MFSQNYLKSTTVMYLKSYFLQFYIDVSIEFKLIIQNRILTTQLVVFFSKIQKTTVEVISIIRRNKQIVWKIFSLKWQWLITNSGSEMNSKSIENG